MWSDFYVLIHTGKGVPLVTLGSFSTHGRKLLCRSFLQTEIFKRVIKTQEVNKTYKAQKVPETYKIHKDMCKAIIARQRRLSDQLNSVQVVQGAPGTQFSQVVLSVTCHQSLMLSGPLSYSSSCKQIPLPLHPHCLKYPVNSLGH